MTAPAKLYVRDGSRYVELSPTLLRDCPPIPTPRTVEEEWRPNFTPVAAARCVHGSFARWARRNCCKHNGG